ncbi:uncharacterized protein N7459_007345 [Penicillium hispanicum]|uniref:uncharacterized protein n=1 Tax=Penicillium hispanicum TaxID=1080232 RepID=UPI0025422D15|nr:uncharacterized protein N7459_007345 [Penicillium hispanicum]KAJ5578381.1 hypothetical protein N7459_007345 [Penicillium hispanicum]
MSTVSKTCQSCASSKVRCIRNAENPHVCNRCLRLGRECLYRQTGRRFHGFQKDRKIEALESKVKELMSDRAVSTREASGGPSETTTSTRSEESATEGDGVGHDGSDEDVIARGFLDMEMAESYVQTFKTVMTPHFPFVVIGPHILASQLRQEKPFLFLAVLASASYENMPLQRSLGAEVKKAVASRMILNGEVSFDMLQGLLVYLAWYASEFTNIDCQRVLVYLTLIDRSHYHTKPHRFTQFLQLAVSLVIELRLDRPPKTETWRTNLRFAPQYDLNEQTNTRLSWGSDEKRAMIGCYYLSSSMAILLQKHSAFPYISYIEDCSQSLDDVGEYYHDKYITHLVQIQHIVGKIDRLSATHFPELSKAGSGSELYVTNVKSDLEAFRSRLHFNLYELPFLAIHFHATELCLYQIALNLANKKSKSQSAAPQLWREEMYCAALNAAESILTLYLSLPTGSELGFTDTQWVQMGFAMLVSCRLLVKLPNSEQKASFLSTLAQVRQRVGSLSTPHVDFNGDRDVFFDFRRRIVQIQSRIENATVSEAATSSNTTVNESVFPVNPADMGAGFLPSSLPPDLFASMTEDGPFTQDYSFHTSNIFDASMGQIMDNWL